MKENTNTEDVKWLITLYLEKGWSGIILKRLRLGWYRGLFYEWESGGYVKRRPLFKVNI